MGDWEAVVNEPFKRSDLETPVGVEAWRFDRRTRNKPANEYQALMEAAPGQEPAPHQPPPDHDPYQTIFERKNIDIELDARELAILDARIVSGLSYREIGNTLNIPATTVYRVYHETVNRIREAGDND